MRSWPRPSLLRFSALFFSLFSLFCLFLLCLLLLLLRLLEPSIAASIQQRRLRRRQRRRRQKEKVASRSISKSLSLSLSLSLVDATISTKTHLYSLCFFIASSSSSSSRFIEQTEPPFFPRPGKFSPRLLFSKKCRGGKEKKDTKNKTRAFDRTHLFWKNTNKQKRRSFSNARCCSNNNNSHSLFSHVYVSFFLWPPFLSFRA